MRVSCSCGTYSIQTEAGLETKLAVGAETNQVEMIIIRPPVDQNQIRFDVAVAMIRPFTGKGMIEVALGGLHRLNRFGIGDQWFKRQCLDLHAELRDMVKQLERPAPEGSA